MKIKSLLLLGVLLVSFQQVFGQLTVSVGTLTPQQMVQNVLVGNGVQVFNITFSGDPNQIGTFNSNGSNIALPSGIVMSSGDVATLVPTGNPSTDYNGAGDADILATAQSVTTNPQAGFINSTNDAAILEFDFIPQGDSVKFNFVFGSEEYTTWINTQYNDAFGFYLSGPNPAGGNYTSTNLALVPNTTLPITISTIHPGLNSQYYIGTPVGHSFNGITTPLGIAFAVSCGQVYHFKFAVADCVDGILDTGVFLEGASFTSDAVDVTVATVSGDTTIVEGCTDANFIFTRPLSQISDTLIVNYTIGGDAIMGTDYNNLINPITFLPGEDTVIINLSPVQDGLNEGFESVTITVELINACGDTIFSSGTIYIGDGPILNITETNPTVLCASDSVLISATASGGYAPYTYQWSYANQTGDTAYVPILQNGTVDVYVTATDQCGFTGTDTVTVTMNQTLAIDTMAMVNTNFCANTGVVWGLAVGQTGQPQFNWSGPSPSSAFTIDASVMQNLPAGMYVFTITDDVCSVTDSIQVGTDPGPIADFTSSLSSGCDPLDVTFTNLSQNATSYSWNFGNGNTANVNDLSTQNQTYSSDATIMLVAYAGVCSDTIYGAVDISICGCMDPIALNYNPLATVDDGSCVFPTPTVSAPNVFTPNGDGSNQVFELTTTNAVKIDLIISNRWGNKMVEKSGLGSSISWDGTVNGMPASEGVYFYQYTVYGVQGDELKGHGFVQLIR
ncbi:MAG: choice-of-anchor L domain-containing protein [Fluviicola sp.]|nr:choice-of-anchor L domain-containing protein [Fluviicola sp.]